jgi:hypothetical protein
MIQVKANEAVTSLLGSLKERAQILDDRGTLIGYFEPVPVNEDELYRRAAALFNAEDIQRSKTAEGPWFTTDEVLGRLGLSGDA